MCHPKASSTPTGQVGDHSSLGSLAGRGLWVPRWLVAERGHSSGMDLVLAPTGHLPESMTHPQRRKRPWEAHSPVQHVKLTELSSEGAGPTWHPASWANSWRRRASHFISCSHRGCHHTQRTAMCVCGISSPCTCSAAECVRPRNAGLSAQRCQAVSAHTLQQHVSSLELYLQELRQGRQHREQLCCKV